MLKCTIAPIKKKYNPSNGYHFEIHYLHEINKNMYFLSNSSLNPKLSFYELTSGTHPKASRGKCWIFAIQASPSCLKH